MYPSGISRLSFSSEEYNKAFLVGIIMGYLDDYMAGRLYRGSPLNISRSILYAVQKLQNPKYNQLEQQQSAGFAIRSLPKPPHAHQFK